MKRDLIHLSTVLANILNEHIYIHGSQLLSRKVIMNKLARRSFPFRYA